jgi:hypothetical protein
MKKLVLLLKIIGIAGVIGCWSDKRLFYLFPCYLVSIIIGWIDGSITLNEGDRVTQGQRIGTCGNSGHSTMPHLHFHLQNSPNFWTAVGLPIRFSNIIKAESDKDELVPVNEDVYISGGQIVGNHL